MKSTRGNNTTQWTSYFGADPDPRNHRPRHNRARSKDLDRVTNVIASLIGVI
jgi:hypothetical protein